MEEGESLSPLLSPALLVTDGDLKIFDDLACRLNDASHEQVGECSQEPCLVQFVVEDVLHEHWQAGEKGVKAPVLSEVGHNNRPH